MAYQTFERGGAPIKAWVDGVFVEDAALRQVGNLSRLPFIHHHVALMPDVHFGIGATVGSVVATYGAVIPAAVGVDIGCGMAAVRLGGITGNDLPTSLAAIRHEIERSVPAGFNAHQDGKWNQTAVAEQMRIVKWLEDKHPKALTKRKKTAAELISTQFGTLGGGNHFIELCLDESNGVWLMLHSGSRGIGNAIGVYFISLAKEEMYKAHIQLDDRDLAYLQEGTQSFDDYIHAVGWAQNYALQNRQEMVRKVLIALRRFLPPFTERDKVVQCHHNYIAKEHHFGADVLVTRKGAVRAGEGELGIIPGSMGTRSYIVRGKGNPESFQTCSHGAGRMMSRTAAKSKFSLEDHIAATQGVECRKDVGVIDETPGAYKDIDAVMAAQTDLVEVVHTLKQVLCVKG